MKPQYDDQVVFSGKCRVHMSMVNSGLFLVGWIFLLRSYFDLIIGLLVESGFPKLLLLHQSESLRNIRIPFEKFLIEACER